jgi:hypothetical protein
MVRDKVKLLTGHPERGVIVDFHAVCSGSAFSFCVNW